MKRGENRVNKKGQLTIFIIVAILIISLIAIFFIYRENAPVKSSSLEISPIVNFVEECMYSTLDYSLYEVAKQGGYSGYSYFSREITDSGERYYLYNGRNYFLSQNLVENQIEEYFERKFFLCTHHFTDFSSYQVEEGILEVSVNIFPDKVKLNAVYPLTIRQGEVLSIVDNFNTEVASKFGIVYNSVDSYMEEQKNTWVICLTCLDTAVRNNIYIEMNKSYNGTVIFTFIDNSSKLNTNPLVWRFANKYY